MNKRSTGKSEMLTMPDCTIIPVLAYPDVAKAIEWLNQAFAFNERWRVGCHRAQLTYGDGTIAINTLQGDVTSAHSRSIFQSLLVRVPDLMEHFERARINGATILHPPADYPYGEKQYTAEDIGGHTWTFSQSMAQLAPEDWGGSTATPALR